MPKKVLIEFTLVEESSEKTNQEIANEIFNELSESKSCFPWCGEVKKVIVTEK
jgi:predicted nucleic-acid-binding protein